MTRVGRFPLRPPDRGGTAASRWRLPGTRGVGLPRWRARQRPRPSLELGLPGIVLAGGGPDTPERAAALGWADLDRAEPLTAGHRFPACAITQLITAIAVLRLVADGGVGLDDPANGHLRGSGLADDAVTVRDLLTRRGTRGAFRFSDAGYGALGQLVADVTGMSYPDGAAGLVLGPLGMRDSSFQGDWPGSDSAAVTRYRLNPEMTFAPAPAAVGTILASRGMWTTAADLLRFGATWSSRSLKRSPAKLSGRRQPGAATGCAPGSAGSWAPRATSSGSAAAGPAHSPRCSSARAPRTGAARLTSP